MAIDINSALNAYNMSLNRAKKSINTGVVDSELKAITPVKPVNSDDDNSFYGIIKQSVQRAESINRKAEDLSKLAIAGQADMREVALAVTQAETSLKTIIGMRDKFLTAYKEILNMPM